MHKIDASDRFTCPYQEDGIDRDQPKNKKDG
jgi:hypothetical protein